MPNLKQRLETLLGHEVELTSTTGVIGDIGFVPNQITKLVEVGEDYLGVERTSTSGNSFLTLILIAHLIHLQHSPQWCSTCPDVINYLP